MRAVLTILTIIIMLCFDVFANTSSLPAFDSTQKFVLDNGLKILVKEDHRAPAAVVMLWYKVGSAQEPAGLTGISHALEHLMFKGTTRYPSGVFSKTIAAIGGSENAFTNYDYTAYYEKVAADKLAICFELEADRMQNLLFNDSEFKQEMKVIREERRLRTEDNPQALTFERFLAAAHLSSPYHHPVIGWMHSLYHLKVNDLKAWYKQFYKPNNATLIVVGDVSPKQVYLLAKKYFAPIASSHTKRPKQITETEPQPLGLKSIEVHANTKLPMLMLGYTVPSLATAKYSWQPYALQIIAAILDIGESGRLTKNLVRGQHLATNVEVSYNLYAQYPTQFILQSSPTFGTSIKKLKEALLHEIKILQDIPINDIELTRVKTQLIANKTFEMDSIFTRAMELGLLEVISHNWQSSYNYSEQINAISANQLQTIAKQYFLSNARTEATLIPSTVINLDKEQKNAN